MSIFFIENRFPFKIGRIRSRLNSHYTTAKAGFHFGAFVCVFVDCIHVGASMELTRTSLLFTNS
jgi:hypothetical protein